MKNWLIGKDPDAGKDWRWEEKGTTENEMVGWHHRLNGHEFEHAPGVGDGQGNLACCNPWGRRVKQYWATKLNLLQEYPLFLFRVTCWCRLIIKMPWFILSNNWYAWNHCLSFPCFSAPFLPLAYSWDFLVPINIRIETEKIVVVSREDWGAKWVRELKGANFQLCKIVHWDVMNSKVYHSGVSQIHIYFLELSGCFWAISNL